MMGGYMESEARAAARWALMQKRAEAIAKQKEAEQSAQLSNINQNA